MLSTATVTFRTHLHLIRVRHQKNMSRQGCGVAKAVNKSALGVGMNTFAYDPYEAMEAIVVQRAITKGKL